MNQNSKIVGHGEKWTRKHEQAVAALLSAPNIEEAAKLAGIGVATLHRWLHRAEFQAAYREARRQTVGQAVAQLQQASSQAVQTLLEVMRNPTAAPSARILAGRVVLEMSFKAIELEDLEERFAALERGCEQQGLLRLA